MQERIDTYETLARQSSLYGLFAFAKKNACRKIFMGTTLKHGAYNTETNKEEGRTD